MGIQFWLRNKSFEEYDANSLPNCFSHNAHIQPEVTVANIKRVELIAMENTSKITSGSAETLHLRQAGDTRLNEVPEFITCNDSTKPGAIRMHVRPGSNNTHMTQQYIDKLWNFVNAGVPQEVPDSRDPVIIYLSLLLVCLPI